MLSELTKDEIDSMLTNQYFGRIGFAADGRVLIEPVMYYYDGHAIYGLTREGTKTTLLRKSPAVCLEIDELVDHYHWRSVVIEGMFEELQGDEMEYAIYFLKKRKIPIFADERLGYKGEPEPQDRKVVYPVVYRINISSITGRSYHYKPDPTNE